MTIATPADRIEAKRIVAAIWTSAEERLGRVPSTSELARWARVYALAALGLDAVAGRIEAPADVPAEEPRPVKPRKAKPAKGKAKSAVKPAAKPAPSTSPKRQRTAARLAGRRVIVPEQLALLDASPSSSSPGPQGPDVELPPAVQTVAAVEEREPAMEPATVPAYRPRRRIVEVTA